MINLYSCGCHAEGDLPVLSRCKEHNGFIIARSGQSRQREEFNAKSAIVWHDTLENNLCRLPDRSFEHIFSYPEHDVFYAYQMSTGKAWRDAEMPMFRHTKRLLRPNGYATFVVDFGVLHTVLYQAGMVGLDYSIGKILYKEFVPEPLYSRAYEFTDAKIIVNLFSKTRERLPESGAHVLDMSSVLLDRTIRRAKGNSVLAFCSCPSRFSHIKRTLK